MAILGIRHPNPIHGEPLSIGIKRKFGKSIRRAYRTIQPSGQIHPSAISPKLMDEIKKYKYLNLKTINKTKQRSTIEKQPLHLAQIHVPLKRVVRHCQTLKSPYIKSFGLFFLTCDSIIA